MKKTCRYLKCFRIKETKREEVGRQVESSRGRRPYRGVNYELSIFSYHGTGAVSLSSTVL